MYGMRAAYGCPGAGMSCVNGRCTTLGALHVMGLAPYEPLAPVAICVTGVGPGTLVEIDLVAPGGQRRRLRRRVPKGGGRVYVETLLPAGPPGGYRIRASAGTRRYTRTLPVIAARRRALRYVPANPQTGDRMRVGLVRYPPGRDIALHVYRLVGELSANKGKPSLQHFRYVTTVHLRTDARGLADAPLRAAPGAPPGNYLFATKPGDWMGGFELGAVEKK